MKSEQASVPEIEELRQLLLGDVQSATVPTIEAAIRTSVQEDSNVLSEALFPVIGPATRKSVASAIKNLTQSLNQGLEHSLSPQSFRWRLEAARTGRSFAEVVLLRTLVYQVEQVLLIHKETGLLLQQVLSDRVAAQDPELVSAMLTAIQDFVQDSFCVESGGSLDTLELGDLTLWIEAGPQAVLACVIRGTAPQELRQTLQTSLEKVHHSFADALQAFDGDQTAFEGSCLYLEDCLQAQFKSKKIGKEPPTLWIVLSLALLGVGSWFSYSFWTQQHWNRYVELLEAEPGLVVLQSQRRHGQYHLLGLRDPLATDPMQLMATQTRLKPETVNARWEPYLALDPALLLKRVTDGLAPPDSVTVELDESQVLRLSGVASQVWLEQAQVMAQASQGWLGNTIQRWDFSRLRSQEQQNLAELKTRIEARIVLFAEAEVEPLDPSLIQQQARDIQVWAQLARSLGQSPRLLLSGQADPRGDRRKNLELSHERARWVQQQLIRQGISPTLLQINALGAMESGAMESGAMESMAADSIAADLEAYPQDPAQARSVRFAIAD